MTLELCDPPVTAQPSLEPVWQKIEADRKDADDGHDRLRKDYRALDDRLERLEHDHYALVRRMDRLEQTPVNVDKMAWSTKQVIAIVSAAVVLAGGMWQLNTGQAALEKQLATAVQESRLNGLKTDDLSKQLTQYLFDHSK
jgi:hypothetical protein